MASRTKVVAKLEVKETAGMRRFLYPLQTLLRGEFAGPRIRVAEADGTLVPSQGDSRVSLQGDHSLEVNFAVSLAPYETRSLIVVETDEVPEIPDPITLTANADGSHEARQSRFAHCIDSAGRIASVVYGGVEHLVGPATITLNDEEQVASYRGKKPVADGLYAWLRYDKVVEQGDKRFGFMTDYALTACKSWIGVVHTVWGGVAEGTRITFTLPTTIMGETTCDFGVGNGLYGKLKPGTIERIVWHTDLADRASWWIGSHAVDCPTARIDAEGVQEDDNFGLGFDSWFHLIGRDKALAVAFEAGSNFFSQADVGLGTDGIVRITLTTKKLQKKAQTITACVWYHFLDDIPPIAAATNPASILLPPSVTVLPV